MAFRRRTEELPSVFSLNDALDAGCARVNASRRAQLQRLLRCADGSAWWCARGKEKTGMRKGWEGKRGQETGDSNCCRCAGCPDKVTELSACTFTYLLWSGLHYTELHRSLLCTSPPHAQTETITLGNTTAEQTSALSQVGAVPGAAGWGSTVMPETESFLPPPLLSPTSLSACSVLGVTSPSRDGKHWIPYLEPGCHIIKIQHSIS